MPKLLSSPAPARTDSTVIVGAKPDADARLPLRGELRTVKADAYHDFFCDSLACDYSDDDYSAPNDGFFGGEEYLRADTPFAYSPSGNNDAEYQFEQSGFPNLGKFNSRGSGRNDDRAGAYIRALASSQMQEALAAARFHRNFALGLDKKEARKLGYHEDSPFARMNNANFPKYYQREYFKSFAERNGYALPPDNDILRPPMAVADEPLNAPVSDGQEIQARKTNKTREEIDQEILDDWKAFKRGRINPRTYFSRIQHHTGPQRIAFALHVARLVARNVSDREQAYQNPDLSYFEAETRKKEGELFIAKSRTSSPVLKPISAPVPIFDIGLSPEPYDMLNDQPPPANAYGSHDARPQSSRNTMSSPEPPDTTPPDTEPVRLNISRGSVVSASSVATNATAVTEVESKSGELIQTKLQRDTRQTIINAYGSEQGLDVINTLLEPRPNSIAFSASPAQADWTPCESWNDVNAVGKLFIQTCNSYNEIAEERTKAITDQACVMHDFLIPRLGMPVVLRWDNEATTINEKNIDAYDASHSYNTLDKPAKPYAFKQFLKDSARVTGGLLSLPVLLVSKSWRKFVWNSLSDPCKNFLMDLGAKAGWFLVFPYQFSSRFRAFYRDRFDFTHRLNEVLTDISIRARQRLQQRNQEYAVNWIKELHSIVETEPENLAMQPGSIDYRDQVAKYINSLRAAMKLNDEDLHKQIRAQLELAIEADWLAAKEKRALDLGVRISHPDATIKHERQLRKYLVEQDFLQAMAKSIADGLREGLASIKEQNPYVGTDSWLASIAIPRDSMTPRGIGSSFFDAASPALGPDTLPNLAPIISGKPDTKGM